jgi:ubiquinone/menaquinone biosynthesis C-methylase UbiE
VSHSGEVPPLPYADGRFSIVTCRFACHHMLDPLAVLKEMRRVCAPSGRVVVVDNDARRGARPSVQRRRETARRLARARHPVEELLALFERAGLRVARTESYRLDNELEDLLSRSFLERLRNLYASLAGDTLGIAIRREGDTLRFGFPVSVIVGHHN